MSEPPELMCYPVDADPPKLVPARAERAWMDETDQRFAYRCIPLSIANASGWELLCPQGFSASWLGHPGREAITVTGRNGAPPPRLVTSHFGHGVLTFHPGWLFRTSPGWALWARGSPNMAKTPLVPLDGLVETDWLPMPFTMNWRFTRPGTVHFAAGEPFCFINLFAHSVADAVQPVRRDLDSEPELKAAYMAWTQGRADFNAKLAAREPGAVAQGWQRHYVKGTGPEGGAPGYHLSKRRLKDLKPDNGG